MKRQLTKTVTATLFVSSLLSSSISANPIKKSTEKQQKPNILLIIADDASFSHFGANGSTWVNTPGYDRIAREGINFMNCYTPNAKSAPSRSNILTGRYSWQLGAAGNHVPIFPEDVKVVTEALTDNGYMVAHTGKGWSPGDPGKINGQPRLLTGKDYKSKKLNPPTNGINICDYVANFKDFLDENKGQSPWFFWLGCFEPHRSYEFGSGQKIGGKNPSLIDNLPFFWPDNDIVRTDMLDYAFEIEYFDKQIVATIDELKKRGILENTIIFVTSDNGMPFPRSKGNSYEEACHMPLAVMWKNGISNPGRIITDYVNFVDFTPTFLELAGISIEKSKMDTPSGRSLNEIFKSAKSGKVINERNYTLLGRERHDYGRPNNQGYPIRSIIKDNMMYIHNLKPNLYPMGNPETGYSDTDGSPTKSEILRMKRSGENMWYYTMCFDFRPEEELYNLTEDPYCIYNLANKPHYTQIKSELRDLLYVDLKKQKDPRVIGSGDVFDSYPFYRKDNYNFWERVQSGGIEKPWEQTGWISPTDFETYKEHEVNNNSKEK